MEKQRTLASRAYYYLSCHRYFVVSAHKEYEESLHLVVRNDGGAICFTVIDLATGEALTFDNPESGEYDIPLNKGSKVKLMIVASKAIGAYKILRKTVIA